METKTLKKLTSFDRILPQFASKDVGHHSSLVDKISKAADIKGERCERGSYYLLIGSPCSYTLYSCATGTVGPFGSTHVSFHFVCVCVYMCVGMELYSLYKRGQRTKKIVLG